MNDTCPVAMLARDALRSTRVSSAASSCTTTSTYAMNCFLLVPFVTQFGSQGWVLTIEHKPCLWIVPQELERLRSRDVFSKARMLRSNLSLMLKVDGEGHNMPSKQSFAIRRLKSEGRHLVSFVSVVSCTPTSSRAIITNWQIPISPAHSGCSTQEYGSCVRKGSWRCISLGSS